MTDADTAWDRLETWLGAHIPALLDDLAPGASPDDMAALAATTGLDLPASLRDLYHRHDGQRGAASGLFFGLTFLTSAGAAKEWTQWTTLLQDDPTLATAVAVAARPEGAVEPVYAHHGWIPIASDGAGNHLAVDLAPGPTGHTGQVICFGADEPTRYVVAPSAPALLAWCAEMLESGMGAVVDDADAPGGAALRLRGASSLLDVLPAVLYPR